MAFTSGWRRVFGQRDERPVEILGRFLASRGTARPHTRSRASEFVLKRDPLVLDGPKRRPLPSDKVLFQLGDDQILCV